jgi:hypothetical protein
VLKNSFALMAAPGSFAEVTQRRGKKKDSPKFTVSSHPAPPRPDPLRVWARIAPYFGDYGDYRHFLR